MSIEPYILLAMSQEKIETAPEHYRAKASEMLKLADEAHTEEARASYRRLAAHWGGLANMIEHPTKQ
jgi:hypothetical protein